MSFYKKNRITRRDFLKLIGKLGVGGIVASWGGLTYASQIEPAWLDVVNVPVVLHRLDNAFSGFRIVQISDIHMGGWMTQERFAAVIDTVLEQSPDLVTITGDFVLVRGGRDLQQDALTSLLQELTRLSAAHTTVAVMGNHDHWAGAYAVRAMLIDANIVELPNDVFSLAHGSSKLYICGVDDIMEGHDNLEDVLEILPDDGAAILLAHEPDFADVSAATGRFDLQISGHSHGGQVVVPGIGPPITPWLAKKYPSGRYRIGSMQQYTNRGVGMSNLDIRFNCRPEVTVFTLYSEGAL